MIIGNDSQVLATAMNHPEVKNAAMKVLISPKEGWTDHVMRILELGKEGYTPRHAHPWPHINYIVEGKGVLHMDGRDTPVEAGSYAFVPADMLHQYRNTGEGVFRFICIVPKEGHIV
jgi:quercetin dioxygenase-like cupin family protein